MNYKAIVVGHSVHIWQPQVDSDPYIGPSEPCLRTPFPSDSFVDFLDYLKSQNVDYILDAWLDWGETGYEHMMVAPCVIVDESYVLFATMLNGEEVREIQYLRNYEAGDEEENS